ncbi:MotB family protein [Oceaniradius stylonematis]|uniref:MotB family protein n=1 Tax=Oceaniradius stylonematis TaxID=2184161 RepID=UPI001314D753|nr:MotB family protein [Oceaniradius stylonematis]
MSAAQDHQEIIIIKRGHDDHDDHHGGAWKIAFADFMTAMFCLFLVLWLVNAANEETKQAVASYFNPVKLVDRNRSVKGLYDAQGIQEVEVIDAEGTGSGGGGETDASGSGQAEEQGNPTGDAAFFADPYEALDQIASSFEAGSTSGLEPQSGARSWSAEQTDASIETFFDPFAPERWSDMPREPLSDAPLSETGAPPAPAPGGQTETALADIAAETEMQPSEPAPEGALQAEPEVAMEAGEPVEAEPATAEAAETAELAAETMDSPQADSLETETPETVPPASEQAAEQLRTALTEVLTEAFGADSVLVEQLSVEAQPDAILISLTDNLQIPMFEIGSAVPSPPLVLALEKVGSVIGERAGGLRIEGHTDARPFISGSSDNWQLSASRAQAAYYMLVRGGVPENRFRAVTGRADRDLAVPGDPFSARNRRIDILLELGS